jgi:hypothetical protein
VPYYRLTGRTAYLGCRHCGQVFFHPTRIPEWRAAVWVLWGFVTKQGDPRMPIRQAASKYA